MELVTLGNSNINAFEDFTMNTFDTMDSETAALILQLQIEDSDELFSYSERKGKGKECVVSDIQLALQYYKADLERNAAIVADRQMTRSIAQACHTDASILASVSLQEQRSVSDRHLALRLGGVTVPSAIALSVVKKEELDDEVLDKLNALYISAAEEDSVPDDDNSKALIPYGLTADSTAESSSWAASRTSRGPKRHCTACQDRFAFCELARVPCGHEYCRDCLQDLFNASMTDDTLFPPRCCREPITPTGNVRIYLTTTIVQRYESKKIEFDTPNRTYCSNPQCSSFIRVEHITGERATCQACQTVTCTICKLTEHGGDCPEDTALQLVLETAKENEWQRCYNCHRLVELDTGCNHMTCPCSAQFCYKCGERWKTCRCEQWDEHRLYARANVVVARQPAHAYQPPEQRQARVAAMAQELVKRHNCGHASWQYVGGRHRCEECHDTLPSYIFRCTQCHLQACNRCRRNRL